MACGSNDGPRTQSFCRDFVLNRSFEFPEVSPLHLQSCVKADGWTLTVRSGPAFTGMVGRSRTLARQGRKDRFQRVDLVFRPEAPDAYTGEYVLKVR